MCSLTVETAEIPAIITTATLENRLYVNIPFTLSALFLNIHENNHSQRHVHIHSNRAFFLEKRCLSSDKQHHSQLSIMYMYIQCQYLKTQIAYYEMQLCKCLHLPGTVQMYFVLFSLCLSYLHVPLVNEHSDCFSIILSLSRALIPGQWIYTVHMCTVLGK